MESKENKLRLFIFILFLGLVYSCSKDDKTELPATGIPEKIWTLKSVQNTISLQVLYFPGIPEKITIEFAENKKLNFSGICNGGEGDYAIQDNKITITSLATTQILCSHIEWEEITVQSLIKATRIELTKSNLVIYCEDSYNLYFE